MVFALVVAGAVAFQLAVALGAPLGAYTMGGRTAGVLPAPMRAAAVVQAIVLAGLGFVVLSAAGLLAPDVARSYPWLIVLPVAFSAVSLVLNGITPSALERRVWFPVAAVLLVSSLVVALSRG
jgi:hypothetical protein